MNICSLVPRQLLDFILQPIFLHGCEIKSGSGLGTRLEHLHVKGHSYLYQRACNNNHDLADIVITEHLREPCIWERVTSFSYIHIQVREDMSTDSVQVQGFVIIYYSDHEVQRKVQSMKHTIKNHEVDVTFQRVCGLVYVIVCNFIKKCNVMQPPHYGNYDGWSCTSSLTLPNDVIRLDHLDFTCSWCGPKKAD